KRACDFSEGAAAGKIAIRREEVCMVEQVEELGTELQLRCFPYVEVFVGGKIKLVECQSTRDIAACISKRSAYRDAEGRGIKIRKSVLRAATRKNGIANHVRTIVVSSTKVLLNP